MHGAIWLLILVLSWSSYGIVRGIVDRLSALLFLPMLCSTTGTGAPDVGVDPTPQIFVVASLWPGQGALAKPYVHTGTRACASTGSHAPRRRPEDCNNAHTVELW